jgi:hypothetical protein
MKVAFSKFSLSAGPLFLKDVYLEEELMYSDIKSTSILSNDVRIPHTHSRNTTTEKMRLPTLTVDEPSLYAEYALTMERRNDCNLRTPNRCFSTNKSLVITFWQQLSNQRWLALNLLKAFPDKYFDYMIMVYDNSSWVQHPAYDKAIWIHVKSQFRFWYVKRFLSPHTLRAYRYVWIIDDDARFHFNTRVYECIAATYNILLSAPGRGDGASIHNITRVSSNYTSKIGRWTDFVEIGPLLIATSSAWICLWYYLSEKTSLGYGFDNIWCSVLGLCLQDSSSSRVCAILDAFVVHHDSKKINTLHHGIAEMPAYQRHYKKHWSKMLEFGPVAPNSTSLDTCISKVSYE